MAKIALIHFLPLEYYPPVTNMINYLTDEFHSDIKLSVFSTHNTKNRKIFNNKKVKIYRTAQSEGDKNRFLRFLKYIRFHLFVLFKLIINRPEKVFYYESLSSFPVYLYKKYINRSAKVYIHYHEYKSPQEYANRSMTIERYFHKLEQKYLYKIAIWISHTNTDRLNFFHKDNPPINNNILKEMPNYPPLSWLVARKKELSKARLPLKCIYIGSLSLKSTYIREFIEWVQKQKGKINFDIYTYNIHSDTLTYLQEINSPYISFNNKGLEYDNLPSVLPKYHIGIILYKGKTKNHEFNAPNKLFEYLSCGLDVWFPDVMKGIMPYVQTKVQPKVIPVNFDSIRNFNWQNSISSDVLNENPAVYICNNVYDKLKKELISE